MAKARSESRQAGGIAYTLTRKPVKHINLRLRADGSVAVSAAPRVPLALIERFVIAKADWIAAARKRVLAEHRPDGAQDALAAGAFSLLGETVAIERRPAARPAARLEGGVLRLYLPHPEDAAAAARIFDKWLRSFCLDYFAAAAKAVHPRFETGTPYPERISVRHMRTRWGSCTPQKKRITLNARLIAAPPPLIEYVVAHELAHFIHPNHSPSFYDCLRRAMPDYAERRRRLKHGRY